MIRSNLLIGLLCVLSMAFVAGKSYAQDAASSPAIFSHIPEWICTPYPDDLSFIRIVGISDPGLSDSVAHVQATFRGVALAALAIQSHGAFLSDFFNETRPDGIHSDYEEIYKLTGYVPGIFLHARTVADTTLESGETIILSDVLWLKENRLSDTAMIVEMTLYIREINTSNHHTLMRKYSFFIRSGGQDSLILDSLSFYRLDRKATGVRSIYPQSQYAYDSLEYYYGNSFSPDTSGVRSSNWSFLHQGVWIACFSQILDHASLFIKNESHRTARVSDRMQSLNIELSRENEKLFFSWRVQRILVQGQKLYMDISFNRIRDSLKTKEHVE